ncbi:hypothetical protein SYNPS1DRAFT_23254 [Syncephalis pseudoplumigaleata]|uniref:Uncharacterized protein n=1 Tax=Syncephalis pseudoplumigaleata TaxID=1712513 RepID=A0A4P9YXR0_9FUNG|nr:hypothetical protein SYNPS1DRAFT_23254 [Syncephalis pseudoplumigaleata]|eukprot:RKP24685.1 hypothetical protein SYNPS1DRAFT_23254 [Syncephalis pseudoplumigaleata]
MSANRSGDASTAPTAAEVALAADTLTVEELLTKVRGYIEECETELAFQCCQHALDLAPDNVEVVDASAVVATELGLLDEAHELWLRSVELEPNKGHEKYLCLGQLSVGPDALQYYEKAVERMSAEHLAYGSDSNEAKVLARQLSSAYVSMTEIYLTDCCFEADAEAKCELYLEQAIKADATNPEVFQTLASVRLSQQRPEEAKEALERSIAQWIDLDPQDAAYPPYESRIALVKLLLELEQFERAITVLDGLQREDDQSVDMWYLFGWTYYCQGEQIADDMERRKEIWEDARECLLQANKLYHQLEHDDEGILEHTQELLDTLNGVLPPRADEEEDDDVMQQQQQQLNGDDVEEEWEDVASSSDEEGDAMEL